MINEQNNDSVYLRTVILAFLLQHQLMPIGDKNSCKYPFSRRIKNSVVDRKAKNAPLLRYSSPKFKLIIWVLQRSGVDIYLRFTNRWGCWNYPLNIQIEITVPLRNRADIPNSSKARVALLENGGFVKCGLCEAVQLPALFWEIILSKRSLPFSPRQITPSTKWCNMNKNKYRIR